MATNMGEDRLIKNLIEVLREEFKKVNVSINMVEFVSGCPEYLTYRVNFEHGLGNPLKSESILVETLMGEDYPYSIDNTLTKYGKNYNDELEDYGYMIFDAYR
ncbi:hypothetical protein J4418_02455 [Candidatus Woesearchaeota archaeon]|nr:hypothetical protein [Candidatus Woesearchaeota archaeon]